MADENIVTNIVAKSDFSNLISDLNKVSFSLTKLQDQLIATNKTLAAQVSVMNRSFADTLRSTGQYSTHFVSLTSDVDKFGMQLERGQLKLSKFFQVYNQHARTNGGLVRDLAKQQVQLQQAILQPLGKNAEGLMQYNVHIPRGLDLVKNKTAIAKQELMIMNKVVQEGANQLINWGKNTQWAGRQLTVGLTVPLAAFGKASADAFRQADEQLVRLTKVYGGVAQTSSQELGKVREDVSRTAADLAKSYGAAFKDTLGLAADIAATGKQGNDLLGAIKETTRLSVLGEVDRQEAMKATLAIQTAFKQNTDELSESINFLNAVENQTSTTLNDLVEAIPKAGPIIRGLGGSVQDLALYLTAMREGGINATEGANALKSALASLINPTNVAVAKFQTFGIDLLGIVNNNAGDVTKTLFALQAALDRLDPLQKQQAIEQLFGKFQFSRLNALFENLGRQGSQTLQVLDLMKASSQELGDLASRELAAVTESASGKYRRAVEGLKADLAGIGDQFLRINTSLINFVDGIIKFVQKLPDPIKQALGFMGMLTAAAGPLIMLTGVLGNFFGYIIKGAYHFKALFKGGEGWKLLTPEILAAQRAGNLVEQTFYSDAKAAAVLKQAIAGLTAEFTLLQQRASSAAMAVNPGISTVAGSTIIAGRVVNPMSPYVGKEGTRAAGHHIPRSTMTEQQRLAQTIHSFTPVPIPLNQKIGVAPQIFTEGDLPRIPGLTTSGGVSTGIVAGEAAKWHALMGTLSMMTKREVRDLKKEIARTGTFSTEINTTFGQLLPAMTKLTSNAAAESALIVQQLQAGKLTVEAARAKIIAINAQLEAMMAQTTTQVATSLGRTADLTQVPLISQPIVSSTGKANIKEIFRPNRPSAKIIDKIARALGVRTWGGGYSTETTMPKRMNMGGYVYTANDGSIVPGPNVNADVVPAVLTPGEFVVNREATQANLPLLTAINNGYNNGGKVRFQRGHVGQTLPAPKSPLTGLYAKSGATSHISQGIPIWMTDTLNQETRTGKKGLSGIQVHDEFMIALKNGRHPFEPLITAARSAGMPKEEEQKILKAFDEMMNDLRGKDSTKQFVGGTPDSFEKYFSKNVTTKFGKNFQQLFNSFGTAYGQRGSRSMVAQGNVSIDPKTRKMSVIRGRGNPLARGISSSVIGSSGGGGSLPSTRAKLSSTIASAALAVVSRGMSMRGHGAQMVSGIRKSQQARYNREDAALLEAMGMKMGMGGIVPGYNRGGMVAPQMPKSIPIPAQDGRYNMGGMVMGYNRGGMVGPMLGMLGSTAGYMGGSALGSMVGGQTGSIVGGIAASMAIPALMVKIGSSTNTATSSLGRFATASKFLGPWGIAASAGVAAAAFALNKYKDKLEETGKLNRLAFAGGVKPLQDFDTKIKDITKSIENARAARELLNTQFTSAGLPGLVLTADQFGKLKDEIEKTYPQLVKLIEKTSTVDLLKVATGLKAQFVAAGDSAASANAKIASLLQLGGKGGMMSAILGGGDMKDIVDATSAIQSMIDTLSSGWSGDTGQSVESMLQLFTSADEYISKQKDTAAGVKSVLDQMNRSSAKNLTLSTEHLNKIKQLSPELRNVLSNTDNVGSAMAKWRIVLSGVTKDLQGLSENELNALAEYSTKISSYFDSIKDVSSKEAQSNPITGAMARDIDKFNKQQLSASKNLTTSINAQVSSKEKLISAIKKEAEARKKALQEQQSAEDTKLQIQKEQLAYQDAIATGNMSAAAQAQINIQRLIGASQLKAAETAIDDAAQKKIDALQKSIESLNTKAKAIESKAPATPRKSPLEEVYTNLNAFLKDVALNAPGGNFTEEQLTSFNTYLTQLSKIPGGQKYVDQLSKTGPVSMVTGRSEGQNELRKLVGTAQGSGLTSDLQLAIGSSQTAAKIDTTNSILTKILATVSGNPEAMQPTGIRVLSSRRGGEYVAGYTLEKAGISAQPKQQFKDKDGNMWEVTSVSSDGIAKVRKITPAPVAPTSKPSTYAPGNYFSYGKKDGGYIKKYDMGGKVYGPGTSTSDSIPAMLSNGEYVIRASAVQSIGVPMLDQINKMAMGGLAARYDVGKKMSMPQNVMGYNRGGPINYYNVGGLAVNAAAGQSPMEIARMTMAMMNSVSTMQAKQAGMPKLVGRGNSL